MNRGETVSNDCRHTRAEEQFIQVPYRHYGTITYAVSKKGAPQLKSLWTFFRITVDLYASSTTEYSNLPIGTYLPSRPSRMDLRLLSQLTLKGRSFICFLTVST